VVSSFRPSLFFFSLWAGWGTLLFCDVVLDEATEHCKDLVLGIGMELAEEEEGFVQGCGFGRRRGEEPGAAKDVFGWDLEGTG